MQFLDALILHWITHVNWFGSFRHRFFILSPRRGFLKEERSWKNSSVHICHISFVVTFHRIGPWMELLIVLFLWFHILFHLFPDQLGEDLPLLLFLFSLCNCLLPLKFLQNSLFKIGFHHRFILEGRSNEVITILNQGSLLFPSSFRNFLCWNKVLFQSGGAEMKFFSDCRLKMFLFHLKLLYKLLLKEFEVRHLLNFALFR